MAFRYSGTVKVSKGGIQTWSDPDIFSFIVTEECRISVDKLPFAYFNEGEEVEIVKDSTYVFDRDMFVKYSYSYTAPAAVHMTHSCTNSVTGTAGWLNCCVLTATQAVTDFQVIVSGQWWEFAGSGTKTFKIMKNGSVTIGSWSVYCAEQASTSISKAILSSAGLSAGDTISLQGYAEDTYSGWQNNQVAANITVDSV